MTSPIPTGCASSLELNPQTPGMECVRLVRPCPANPRNRTRWDEGNLDGIHLKGVKAAPCRNVARYSLGRGCHPVRVQGIAAARSRRGTREGRGPWACVCARLSRTKRSDPMIASCCCLPNAAARLGSRSRSMQMHARRALLGGTQIIQFGASPVPPVTSSSSAQIDGNARVLFHSPQLLSVISVHVTFMLRQVRVD